MTAPPKLSPTHITNSLVNPRPILTPNVLFFLQHRGNYYTTMNPYYPLPPVLRSSIVSFYSTQCPLLPSNIFLDIVVALYVIYLLFRFCILKTDSFSLYEISCKPQRISYMTLTSFKWRQVSYIYIYFANH